jgi:hypothetical protein
VLYQPRDEGRGLPLSLLHVGSGLGAPVVLVDGRHDLAPEARISELARDALCLGVSVRTGKPLADAIQISRVARAARRSLPVIWGGPHATFVPEDCLATDDVDACVAGQGERTFALVVAALLRGGAQEGIPGLVWSEGGAIAHSLPRPFEDVNAFPSVDYGLVDLEAYFRARGVRCLDYCSSQTGTDAAGGEASAWSGLVPERVAAEVHILSARHRLAEVAFKDADFFFDAGRAASIAERLAASGLRVAWSASGRPERLGALPAESFQLFRASGCRQVRVDVGPVGERSPDAAPSFAGVLETAEKLRQAGIGARFGFVVGRQGESRRALAESYRMAKAIRRIGPEFETPLWLDVPYPASNGTTDGAASFGGWDRIDDRRSPGPWTPASARRWVPRWNFYLGYGFAPPGRRVARRVLRRLARARIALDFYRMDLDRRAVAFFRRARTGSAEPWPIVTED